MRVDRKNWEVEVMMMRMNGNSNRTMKRNPKRRR